MGRVLRVFLIASSLAFVPLQSRGQETITTLREVLAQGQAALAAGEYETAFKAFEEIQTTFSQEPEVSERVFQLTIKPLHAYSALLSGDTEVAIRLFSAFVEEFPDDRTRLSFVFFNLARAYADEEQFDNAIETYKRFVALDPNRAEATLATLEAARLMFKAEKEEEAFETLDNLYSKQRDGVLRTKARLIALQEALERERTEQARDYMLHSDWSLKDMPEITLLAYAALEMGQQLLANGEYTDAIECYRLVPPYEVLLKIQEQRLLETQTRFEERRASVGLYQGGQFWTQYYTRLIASMEGQLKGLQAAEDYTTPLYMAFGQAYLLGNRPREAWILFENLARDPELNKQQQSEAHYRWILSAIEIGVWEDAFKIAKGFGLRFPESPLVPDALHLLGSAYQEARQYADAIEVFTEFLTHHPDHALAGRTRFLRGYNYNLMNQPVEAREDFERFIQDYPNNFLFKEARLWRALTYFSERNYEDTLSALRELLPSVQGGRLEPEVEYRIASTLYAMRDYDNSLANIESFLERFPLHGRANEARVLLGDIQMGRGELATARTIYEAIDPDAGHLFTYSVFQAGKILRAVAGAAEEIDRREGLLTAHIEHFQNYLTREDVPLKGRVSEALYWVGWTRAERGEEDQARLVFKQALEEYGDDMESGEVPMIIDAYARIEKRLTQMGRKERETQLKAWIDEAKKEALKQDRLTYFARLSLYIQSMVPPDDPTNMTFEIIQKVPIERIDAEGLGRIASSMVHKYPQVAEDYLIRLEDEYPDSRHRSYAYYTRAQLLMQAGEYEEARAYLGRFRAETPLHPLAINVSLDYAETLTQSGEYEEAQTVLEDLLRLRTAKGRPHAKALLALSKNAESSGNIKRAVPYAQRVYNVYRAYHDLAAEAYWLSALQFEALGDELAAYRTLEEMLADPKISELPLAEEAEAKFISLKAALPENALNPVETESTDEVLEMEATG